MSFFDRFKDRAEPAAGASAADNQAIARYRYLVRTAPPEAIEEAHAEAFARLTPEQRRRLLDEIVQDLPPAERNATSRASDTPGVLARVATRAELRQPGAVERAWTRLGGAGPAGAGAMGFGGMLASSLLGSLAGSVIGTPIAQSFFTHDAGAVSLFGGAAGAGADGASGSLADDKWAGIDSQAADSGDFTDLGGGFDGDTFDI